LSKTRTPPDSLKYKSKSSCLKQRAIPHFTTNASQSLTNS